MLKANVVILVVIIFGLFIFSQESPVVKITSPNAGQISKRLIDVEGTISDSNITRGYIVVNAVGYMFDISQGNFKYPLILCPGENIIQIIVENSFGIGQDTLILYASVPSRDMQITMTWDTGTDMDLHVIDPANEETYYSVKNSSIGGQLDRDDTDGFGPETFTLSNAIEGKYVVKAKYYGGQAAPTLVKISTILFAGTNREELREYFSLFTQSGEFSEICSFFVNQ